MLMTDSVANKISLVSSTPPALPEIRGALQTALEAIVRDPSFPTLIQQHRFGGTRADKDAAAAWLSERFGEAVDPNRIIITGSAQNAMSLLLSQRVRSGGTIAVEALSYHGLRMISRSLGIKMVTIDMDDQGAIPASFADVCSRDRPSAVYLMPTLHNPTTAIMSLDRRKEVISIARAHGVMIIEDDVYGGLLKSSPAPLSALAPDLTWHITSFAKTLGPGVRVGYLVAPANEAAAILVDEVHGTSAWFPAPIAAEIVRNWIDSGTMRLLRDAIRQEAEQRQRIARAFFSDDLLTTHAGSLFAWLQLPHGVDQNELIEAVSRDGITLRNGSVFEEKPGASLGYTRLVFGSPDTQEDLSRALCSISSFINLHAT